MNQNDLPAADNFTIAKGQDWPLELRIFGVEKSIKVAADAATGATTLVVESDHPALSTGDKLLVGRNVVVTVGADAAAGVQSVTVSAISGPLARGDRGRLLRDLTGWTIEFEALAAAADATPVISKSGATVTVLSQVGDSRGLVLISGLAADTASVTPGEYAWFAWRRDAGYTRPIARGSLTVEAQGFL